MSTHRHVDNSELKQILLSIIGNVPVGIIALNFNGKIILMNEQAAGILEVNKKLQTCIDLPLTDLLFKESKFYATINKCITEGMSIFNLENEGFKEKILTVKGRPFINGIIITIEDVTQSFEFKQLEFKNKELEEFSYITSHDLQEPLNSIISFASLLEDRKTNLDSVGQKSIDVIVSSAYRMKEFIKVLLEFSRIGQRQEKNEVKIIQLIEDLKTDLHNLIETKKATVEYIGKPITINVFEPDFIKLLQNLVVNGIKYTDSETKPKIIIDVKELPELFEFSIQDNGIGIAEEYYDKIFGVFERLHTRDKISGTGIGLSHCKKVVELHGGEIWLTSEVGKGTTFYFTVPK